MADEPAFAFDIAPGVCVDSRLAACVICKLEKTECPIKTPYSSKIVCSLQRTERHQDWPKRNWPENDQLAGMCSDNPNLPKEANKAKCFAVSCFVLCASLPPKKTRGAYLAGTRVERAGAELC